MELAIWVTVCVVLVAVAAGLGVLLRREQGATAHLRERLAAVERRAEHQQNELQRVPPPPPPVTDDGAEAERRRQVRSAQEAVNGTVRRMQALGNEAGDRIQGVLHAHGPDVFQALLPVDHVVAQMQRRLQVLAVMCGSWPGQQRGSAELADVVRGAQSRIHDYGRVRAAAPDEKTALTGRVVEPVGMALAELLDNATRSSPPSSAVDVVFDTDYHGVSVSVVDGGVGMTREELAHATTLLYRGQREADLTELGNPPKTGFAVCGVLAARYGFRVSLDSGSSRGGLRATLFLPTALLTTVDTDEAELEPVPVPAATSWPQEEEAVPVNDTTAGGLPKRRRSALPAQQPAYSAPTPTPAPSPSPRSTDTTADNLRAFQQGTRMAAEGRQGNDG
ncbi:ATP-binding protein [Amycolatopsis antarctica]|uniref:histidine kinase n=1 Tax=Amycolatopsis antarctica TaxID=1854586 RepID=A0A263D2G5_9PSEU|nr:ATP-binding protein [Amycolatopsis antarctica]OZM72268.1 ATP-binding protein [Amycolatopsis antarctica]